MHFRIPKSLGLLLPLMLLPPQASADTVSSLLGNFTYNQFCGLKIGESQAQLHYVIIFGQLPALKELHEADSDGNGVTSEAERNAYAQQLGSTIATRLQLGIDGESVPLHATKWLTSLPSEQAGFSLRLDIDFVGELKPGTASTTHKVEFANRNYAERVGWREIAVTAETGLSLFDGDAYADSLTDGLQQNPQSLPANGPPDEREVKFSFSNTLPDGARALPRRADTQPATATNGNAAVPDHDPAAGFSTGDNSWLQQRTRELVDRISSPQTSPGVAALALLIATVLGALHAFSPGHGKTVVGAYLIGSRGTARHAVFLGAAVTVTHTLGVFALGFATLFASRFIVPEKLLPVLSLISGLLVLGMGLVLLRQRWSGIGSPADGHSHDAGHPDDAATKVWRLSADAPLMTRGQSPLIAHSHAMHDHGHDHGDHHHHHHGGLVHSHGGSTHSHLPPGADGEKVTWKSLLALGISGGLVPCPSALVLLLAAVALNRTAYGLLLVVFFSLGLAVTLTLVGLMFLHARTRLSKQFGGGEQRWVQLLPVASAAAITLVGVMLSYGAWLSFRP